MEFILDNGTDNPTHWTAKGQGYRYAIAMYTYSQNRGWYDAYFKAYFYPGGNTIDQHTEHKTFDAAVAACEDHLCKREKESS